MLLTNKLPLNPRMLEDAQILVVDNDRDSRDLFAFVLEDHGAKVTTSGSIQDALDFLDWYIPTVLICEMRFLGESVYPLIQRVRFLAFSSGRPLPILVTSTCDPISLVQQLTVKIEAYLLKPIDIDDFVDQVWNLARLSSTVYLPSYPPILGDWITKSNIVLPC
jgi:CheY-like chemotaxis protein